MHLSLAAYNSMTDGNNAVHNITRVQYTSINYKYSSVVQIGEANITVIEAELALWMPYSD